MLTKGRVVQLLFMMAILLLLFFWRTFDVEANVTANETTELSPQMSLLRCDYVKACEFVTEQGTFLLSVKNLPIKPEEWIDFELLSPLKNTHINSAKIVSKSMFMGKIPVKFKKTAPQTFSARGIVGACITDKMIWELHISIDNDEQNEVLVFDFMVKKNA